MYRNPVIVQISDLHFGKNVRPYRFWASSINEDAKIALRQAIQQIVPRPDFLVVTGDVANRGKVWEMEEGRTYLRSILDGLWAEKHATRCILVPGNHDVWRTTWARPWGGARKNRLKEWNCVFEDWSFLAPSVKDGDPVDDLRPFSMLSYYQAKGFADAEQRAKKAMRVCEYFPTFNIAFLKLDSNIKTQIGPAHIARGEVGLPQRVEVENTLRDFEKATETLNHPFAEARRIVLVHHHLTRLPYVKLENYMLMDDAGEVARWLARNDVRFVLHGHFHTADSAGLTYWNTEAQNSRVETIIVSAGSATARDVDDRHNSCHYFAMGHFQTTLHRPYLDHGDFQPLATAARFQFLHKPNLTIEDNLPARAPLYVEPLEALVVREEGYADQDHVYKSIKSTGFIDQDRNYLGSVELEGENKTTQATNSIPFVFTAAGSQYFQECNPTAIDVNTRSALNMQLVEDRPISVFPTRVLFANPVPAGGDFKIRVQYRLKMVMLEEWDYDMLSLVRFPRGVARMEFILLSHKTMLAPTLWELRGNKLRRSRSNLSQVNLVPPNSSQAQQAPAAGYGVTVDSPAAMAYLLLYEKLS